MKYCSHCGNPLADDAKFCPSCGASATPEEATPTSVTPEEATSVTPQEATSVTPQEATSVTPQEATSVTAQDAPCEMPQETEKPKKKRKGLIIAIAVVAVLAIAAALYFFVFRPTQEAHSIPETAAEKTMAQLQDVFGDCENLNALCENLRSIALSGQLTVRLAAKVTEDEAVNMTLHYDGVNSQLGGVIDLDGVELEYYADEDGLVIRCADFDDSYFMVPLENFGEAFADSALAEMIGVEDSEELRAFGIRLFMQTDWDEFAEKNPDAAKFVDSLNFVETDKAIPNAEGMTVYEVSIDVKDIAEFYSSYMTYASALLTGSALSEDEIFAGFDEDDQLTVQIGINADGYLAAVHLFLEGEDGSVTVVCGGEENLFEEIKFYEDEKQIYTLSLEKTKDGFTLFGGEEELMPLLVCKDDVCELTLYQYDGEQDVTIRYGAAKDGVSFEVDAAQEDDSYGDSEAEGFASGATTVHTTVKILPFEGVEAPNGEVTALFDLTQAEVQALAMRLMGLIYGSYDFGE